jgi:hypothetical protein
MPADPVLDQTYRQEQGPGEANDRFTFSSLAAWVRVPAVGTSKAIRTEERNPQEPKVLLEKHDVRGFGLVREATLRGDESELLEPSGSHTTNARGAPTRQTPRWSQAFPGVVRGFLKNRR